MTEEEEFSTVVFVKVDCDELEVCIKTLKLALLRTDYYYAHAIEGVGAL